MKFRKEENTAASDQGREEIREIAEALSLWRSAMRHVADRAAGRPFVPERPHRRALRLLLAPALTAAVVAGVFFPVYSYSHRHVVVVRPRVAAVQSNPAAIARMDDTALMNQIDSELSQDVPDALEPLAVLSSQASATIATSEKKNVTNE